MWVRALSRSFKMVQFVSLGAVSYSPSIATMALSCISSEIKLDIGRKSWFFLYLRLAFGAPVRVSPSEYCHPVCCEKLQWKATRRWKNFEDMYNSYLYNSSQYRRVTNRQTDILPRHSSRYNRATCMHTSRGKKTRPTTFTTLNQSVTKTQTLHPVS